MSKRRIGNPCDYCLSVLREVFKGLPKVILTPAEMWLILQTHQKLPSEYQFTDIMTTMFQNRDVFRWKEESGRFEVTLEESKK